MRTLPVWRGGTEGGIAEWELMKALLSSCTVCCLLDLADKENLFARSSLSAWGCGRALVFPITLIRLAAVIDRLPE